MTNRVKLTTTSVKRSRDAHVKGIRQRVWDSEVPGLFLKINPGGSATWAMKVKRKDGSKAEPKLGSADKITLDEARRLAKREFALEAEGRADLVTRRRQEQYEAKRLREETMEALAEAYLESLSIAGRSIAYIRDNRRMLETHVLPTLGKRPFREVTRSDVETVIRATQRRAAAHTRSRAEEEGTSGARRANAVHTLIKSLFKWASRKDDTLRGWNPAELDRPLFDSRPVRRDMMEPEVLEAMLKALGRSLTGDSKVGGECTALVIMLASVTLQRPNEVAAAERKHIDWTEGAEVWTIPAQNAKARRPYKVPLSPLAVALFKQAFALHNYPWLSTRLDEAGPTDITVLSRRWARVKSTASQIAPHIADKIEVSELYDCRRLGRTLIEHQLGYSIRVAEACINHAERSDFSVRYDVADLSGKVREAMNDWSECFNYLPACAASTDKTRCVA